MSDVTFHVIIDIIIIIQIYIMYFQEDVHCLYYIQYMYYRGGVPL